VVSNVAVDPERFDDVKGKRCRYAFVQAMVSLASVELESSHNVLVFVSVLVAAATVFACGFRRGDATEQVPQGRDHQWIKDRFGKPKLNTARFIGCFDRLCAATNFGCNVCGRVCTPEAKFLRSHHNNRSIREWLWMWLWLGNLAPYSDGFVSVRNPKPNPNRKTATWTEHASMVVA
jgi:hypothetical protein